MEFTKTKKLVSVGRYNVLSLSQPLTKGNTLLNSRLQPKIGLGSEAIIERGLIGYVLNSQKGFYHYSGRLGPFLKRFETAPFSEQSSVLSGISYQNRSERFQNVSGTPDYLFQEKDPPEDLFSLTKQTSTLSLKKENFLPAPSKGLTPLFFMVKRLSLAFKNKHRFKLNPNKMRRFRKFLHEYRLRVMNSFRIRRHHLRAFRRLRALKKRTRLKQRVLARVRSNRSNTINMRWRTVLLKVHHQRSYSSRLYRYVRTHPNEGTRPPQFWFNSRKRHRWNYHKGWVSFFRERRRPDPEYRRRVHLNRRWKRKPYRKYDYKLFAGDFFAWNHQDDRYSLSIQKDFERRLPYWKWCRPNGWGSATDSVLRVRRSFKVTTRLRRRPRFVSRSSLQSGFNRRRPYRKRQSMPVVLKNRLRPLLTQKLKPKTLTNRSKRRRLLMTRRRKNKLLNLVRFGRSKFDKKKQKQAVLKRRWSLLKRSRFSRIQRRKYLARRARAVRQKVVWLRQKGDPLHKIYSESVIKEDLNENQNILELTVQRVVNGFQREGLGQRVENLFRELRSSFKSSPQYKLGNLFYELFTTIGVYRKRRGGLLESIPTVLTPLQSLKLSRSWIRSTFKKATGLTLSERVETALTKPNTVLKNLHNASAVNNLAYF